jgi:hypothetical protein
MDHEDCRHYRLIERSAARVGWQPSRMIFGGRAIIHRSAGKIAPTSAAVGRMGGARSGLMSRRLSRLTYAFDI